MPKSLQKVTPFSLSFYFFVSCCKKRVFKQNFVNFINISRRFSIFKFLFSRERFLIHNGFKFFERRITSCNFIFFKFGDFCSTKKRGSLIHLRNNSNKVNIKKSKYISKQRKKKRRLLEQSQVSQKDLKNVIKNSNTQSNSNSNKQNIQKKKSK